MSWSLRWRHLRRRNIFEPWLPVITGIFLTTLGLVTLWLGVTANDFYASFPGSLARKKVRKWYGRAVHLAIGMMFIWTGLRMLAPTIAPPFPLAHKVRTIR